MHVVFAFCINRNEIKSWQRPSENIIRKMYLSQAYVKKNTITLFHSFRLGDEQDYLRGSSDRSLFAPQISATHLLPDVREEET